MDNSNWYVLQTRSRFEKKCSELLTKSGVEVFLPLRVVHKQWSDRIKKVEELLFPGYIFVKYDESNRYKILNTQGVCRFVSFDGKYAKVHPKHIDFIMQILTSDNTFEVLNTELIIGEKVLITSGPFKGIEAKLIDQNGKGKILLEVEAIGQGVILEIGNANIEKI
jgi:transcription antitermination factor NusG